jgi:ligand-binding sensor domain-containing protein
MIAIRRKILFVLLTLAFLFGVYELINSPDPASATAPEATTPLPAGVDQLLRGHEFSALAVLETPPGRALYAGGTDGLYRIDPETLACTEIRADGRAFPAVRALLADGGQLWIGYQGGVVLLQADGSVSRRIGRADGLADTRVLDLLRATPQTLYIATYSGLGILEGGAVRWTDRAEDLPGESIKVLFLDSQGDIWMGAYNARGGGVLVEKDGQRQFLSLADGLVHNSITSIAELPDGRIAVGGGVYTEGGVSLLRQVRGRWQVEKNLRHADGLAGEKVRHIFVDRSRRVWYCSEYDGIAIFDQDRPVRLLTTQDGLSDNEVKKIVQLDTGDYWLATRDGLTRIRGDAALVR